MKFPKENIIDNWLEKYGDPEIDSFIEKNLAITEKVRLAMEAKGWKAQDLAKAMNKKPSEVSRWLTGMHNLTLKSIIKLECALGMDLIHCEPVKEYQYIVIPYYKEKKKCKQKSGHYIATEPMNNVEMPI